jgi:mannitol/fructose-specific phosphotransferase system IIA component (Ntr-type)
MIQKLIDAAAMIGELEAKTKDAALKELLGAAMNAGAFPQKSLKTLAKRLADREAIGSTGLGNTVAVPHVKGEEIAVPTLVLARCKKGLEWQAIDGRPVHAVFLLASPASEPEAHLQCLRWIAGLARSADFRRFLADAKDGAAMRDLLREMSGKVGP